MEYRYILKFCSVYKLVDKFNKCFINLKIENLCTYNNNTGYFKVYVFV